MDAQGLTSLEHDVIEALLKADHPVFDSLRLQFARCRAVSREYTGVGFFTTLAVPASVSPAGVDGLALSDVHAELVGLEHGAGFVLWVEQGLLNQLEGFTYDGQPWPEAVPGHRVFGEHPAGNAPTDLELVEAAFHRRSPGDSGGR
jgi:hypothetical protein